MEKAIVDFFNYLPEVLQETPGLYITVVCLAAGFMWLKLPFPGSLRYPFVWMVGEVTAISTITPVPRALGMGFIYAAISIASFATVMKWLETKENAIFEIPFRNSNPAVVETVPKQDKIDT